MTTALPVSTTSVESVADANGLWFVRLMNGDTVAEVCPGRGALVTRLCIGDDELLYLDEETLRDPRQNVRGGVPVLFPIAGRLPGDVYEAEGRALSMKQHGFARNRAFDVTSRETGPDGARVVCRLASDASTLAQYPWRFELTLAFTLQPARLVIDAVIANCDTRPMPHALGYHPYFRVELERKGDVRIETDATEALDNRTGAVVPEAGRGPGELCSTGRGGEPRVWMAPDFAQGEIDLHLVDHRLPGTVVSRRPLRPVRLEWDDAFTTLVLWTLPGRPFVCVEPWTQAAGALARGEARTLAPGTSETLRVAISA